MSPMLRGLGTKNIPHHKGRPGDVAVASSSRPWHVPSRQALRCDTNSGRAVLAVEKVEVVMEASELLPLWSPGEVPDNHTLRHHLADRIA